MTRRITLGFIVEVRRGERAALAAGGDRLRAYAVAELDHGDEAVTARAVPLLGVGIGAGSERGERAPRAGRERHRNAGAGVVEMGRDVVVDALKAIDVAPRRPPAAEVPGKGVDRIVERAEQVGAGRAARPHVLHLRDAGGPRARG